MATTATKVPESTIEAAKASFHRLLCAANKRPRTPSGQRCVGRPVSCEGCQAVPRGERLYRALAILVTGAIAAATAALIAAIALISRKKPGR